MGLGRKGRVRSGTEVGESSWWSRSGSAMTSGRARAGIGAAAGSLFAVYETDSSVLGALEGEAMSQMHYALDRVARVPAVAVSRRGGFAAVAYALAVTMLGTTLPTPRYALYRARFGCSERL